MACNADKNTPADRTMWSLDFALPSATIFLNFRSEDHVACTGAAGWLAEEGWVLQEHMSSTVSSGYPNGPYQGPVFSRHLDAAGTVRLRGSNCKEGIYFVFIQLPQGSDVHNFEAPGRHAAGPNQGPERAAREISREQEVGMTDASWSSRTRDGMPSTSLRLDAARLVERHLGREMGSRDMVVAACALLARAETSSGYEGGSRGWMEDDTKNDQKAEGVQGCKPVSVSHKPVSVSL